MTPNSGIDSRGEPSALTACEQAVAQVRSRAAPGNHREPGRIVAQPNAAVRTGRQHRRHQNSGESERVRNPPHCDRGDRRSKVWAVYGPFPAWQVLGPTFILCTVTNGTFGLLGLVTAFPCGAAAFIGERPLAWRGESGCATNESGDKSPHSRDATASPVEYTSRYADEPENPGQPG